jgi:hypothetical protein
MREQMRGTGDKDNRGEEIAQVREIAEKVNSAERASFDQAVDLHTHGYQGQQPKEEAQDNQQGAFCHGLPRFHASLSRHSLKEYYVACRYSAPGLSRIPLAGPPVGPRFCTAE